MLRFSYPNIDARYYENALKGDDLVQAIEHVFGSMTLESVTVEIKP